jgi:Zn-finger nucleic acid-binding protein
MQCAACGAAIDLRGVFPDVEIACGACGARNVTGEGEERRLGSDGTPYRTAEVGGGDVAYARPASPAELPRCPRCGRALAGAGGALECSACTGTFLDHHAFAARVAEADAHRTGAPFTHRKKFDPDVRAFPCPRCRRNMERASFGARSGIFLDTCAEHGTWFDARELDDALDYVRAVGLDQVREAEERARARLARSGAPATGAAADPRGAAAKLRVELLSEQRREQRMVDAFGRATYGHGVDLLGLIVQQLLD